MPLTAEGRGTARHPRGVSLPARWSLVIGIATALMLVPATSGAAQHPRHQDLPATTVVPSGSTPPTTTTPVTTSTLPIGRGSGGRIIPLPNSGAEPESPGDRGGWQQLALFVLVCVVIVGMGVFVWWRSRVARERRRAAGLDPVVVAAEHGADVRKPRPPGIVD